TMRGGILSSRAFGADPAADAKGDFSFAQISDSHIGFSKEINKDVAGTLQLAVDRVNAMPTRAELLIHTGDLTHQSKPEEFDAVDQILRGAKVGQTFYTPGEHDYFSDDGRQYLDRFGKGTRGAGWHSYTHKGVHFVGLVNVASLKPGGLGVIGREQLDWLKKDLESVGPSTPIVMYAHVPLWAVYPEWGWGTSDSEEALSYVKRFAAVTVLNGHIHQVLQKTEGHVTFHTARSTAFPQPEPGKAASPGPIKTVAAEKLRSMLGLTTVNYVQNGPGSLAIVDTTLE
ncbi:MAG: metallophosphoesterase, partial [Phycisphaerales bacterium]|nr:metallophosphoesterase [Phycisphaerales bacterium]